MRIFVKKYVMMKSMTGYGKAELELANKKVIIEIRTLNSRQMDINTRIPFIYRAKELEIRNLLSSKLERGKIDLQIAIEQTGNAISYSFNNLLAVKYYEELKALAEAIQQPNFSNYLPLILKMPDVMKPENEILDENEYKKFENTLLKAIDKANEFRLQEGAILQKEFIARIHTIKRLLSSIEPFEKARIQHIRHRIYQNLSEFKEEVQIDQNRFEQELVFYIEKFDITEEKVRLKKHCDYFLESMQEDCSLGKKLNFITQEIGREINTLGSKANEINIQKIVIQMKDELEKIKEQLLNIL